MAAICSPGHLRFKQGKTKEVIFYYREPDEVTPIDITGLEARIRFSARYDSATPLMEFSSSPVDGITLNKPLGEISLRVSAVETALLNPNVKLVWELELYDPLDPSEVLGLISDTADVIPRVP